MTEIRCFMDFYRHLIQHPEEINCPDCGKPAIAKIYTGLNMNLAGQAKMTCPDPKCQFNQMNFTVEAVR